MTKMCEICGDRFASEEHHLIYGRAERKLCDEDGLTLNLCQVCHRSIHIHGTAGMLSKMLGQALWEINALNDGVDQYEVRDKFRERYGRSWL